MLVVFLVLSVSFVCPALFVVLELFLVENVCLQLLLLVVTCRVRVFVLSL